MDDTGVVVVPPQDVLREMSRRAVQALAVSPRPDEQLAVDEPLLLRLSSEMQAVASVFVMLDLLDEAEAERMLDDHRAALYKHGIRPRSVRDGELTLRPTSAYGFQAARRRRADSLPNCAVTAATPERHITLPGCDVIIEWLVVTPSGVRGRGVITSSTGELTAQHANVEIPGTDDAGRKCVLRLHAGGAVTVSRRPRWVGAASVSAEITTDPPLAVDAAWIELLPMHAAPVKISLTDPPHLPSGRSKPPWSTPGEWFLENLLPDLTCTDADASFGVGLDVTAVRQLGATVADALLAVGALPASSPLLTRYPQRDDPWHHELVSRYTNRANRAASAGASRRVAGGGITFPLETAVAALDAVIVHDRDVMVHAYAFPDALGEYWPVAFRPFSFSARDDLGHRHRAVPGTYWAFHENEGFGDLWLWPPLHPDVRLLRMTVTTPWEEAWVDVALPTQ